MIQPEDRPPYGPLPGPSGPIVCEQPVPVAEEEDEE